MPNEIEPLIPTFHFFPPREAMATKKWQLLNYLFFLLLNQATIYGVTSKHLHLKILVPDVINHHTHTRTVLLHVHVPTPKKPRTYKKHEYSSNWSSWSRGRYHNHRDEYGDHELDHENYHDEKSGRNGKRPDDDKRRRQKYFPVYDYHKEYPSSYDAEGNDLEEKDRGRDSYAVHEDVNDIPPNTETVSYNYEEGYRKGGEVESGHIRADQTRKFHEDRHEEQGDAENDGFKDEFETKTDAGRYLVDDVEYENTRDKRHHGRRARKIRKSVDENV
ncbi:LOW QUALITY PROTEIN: uncharacterized protein LOC102680426 [Apis dorsata]|uniref:LOW QUALITY PROTEIN: uncharacterized protein LOC102680426 n=1 Tax=Apis dorsata TaxID=7462 RepID=UPI001293B8E1|nr:LOW QUALITY PROTEIN: uncharacterized protein LOC102680426 [Apis dorsata]